MYSELRSDLWIIPEHECGRRKCFKIKQKTDFLCRDVKPENVLVGRTERMKENVLHVVDFGLAKPYIDSETKKHIAFAEKRSIIGRFWLQ